MDLNLEPTIREASEFEAIKPAQFIFRRTFMAMEHNYYCAVCREKPAVCETWHGLLQPCWDCMAKGYYLRKENWIAKLWKGLFK